MSYNLYIDDERLPFTSVKEGKIPEGLSPWVVVTNLYELTKVLKEGGCPDIVSFDYFLKRGQTGAEAARIIRSFSDKRPKQYFIHSSADNKLKAEISEIMDAP